MRNGLSLIRRDWRARLVVFTLPLAVLLANAITLLPPASAHAPHAGLDFAMAVDADGDTGDDCSTRPSESSTCRAAQGSTVQARIYLESLGDIPSYSQLQLHFGYTGGVQSLSSTDSVWPGCLVESVDYFPTYEHARCHAGVGNPAVSNTGLAATALLYCGADGVMDIRHALVPAHTLLYEAGTTTHAEGDDTVETLSVTCAPPQPYPADNDGDGCPDASEAGTDSLSGGDRNFLNSWDYFNPTHDGLNRSDDIVKVVQQFDDDDSDSNPGQPPYTAGYDPDTDRTLMGPDPWNLGPPNGQQRVDDIIYQTKQFFHDCA